jgi:hypothetical protein
MKPRGYVFLVNLTPKLSFKDLELVYSISFDNTTYRRSSFYVGWMGGMLINNNSLSP